MTDGRYVPQHTIFQPYVPRSTFWFGHWRDTAILTVTYWHHTVTFTFVQVCTVLIYSRVEKDKVSKRDPILDGYQIAIISSYCLVVHSTISVGTVSNVSWHKRRNGGETWRESRG